MYKCKSPAKINWFLDIVEKREDSYHNLYTLMQKIDLQDSLYFSFDFIPIQNQRFPCHKTIIRWHDREIFFSFVSQEQLEIDSNNTIIRAMDVYLKEHSALQQVMHEQIHIHLDKNIPVQGGMAGGSSNAAAMLRILNQLALDNQLEAFSDEKLCALGKSIGADVPFCVHPAKVALCQGIGDIIQEVSDIEEKYPLLLFLPSIKTSTATAFRKFSEQTENKNQLPKSNASKFLQAMRKGDLKELEQYGYNHFFMLQKQEDSRLQDIYNLLQESGASYVQMTGSGASFFALYENDAKRETARRYITSKEGKYSFDWILEFSEVVDSFGDSCL